MITLVEIFLWLLAVPATAASLYLLLLTLLSGSTGRAPPPRRRMRFDVIVPAHNEAMAIAGVIANLRQLDWRADSWRIVVVADNCTDATAALARAAGANVLERHDTQHRGKGHALAFAFDASRELGWADAVVVVDADTEVSSNLLHAFSARLQIGAHAVQAHYGVRNAQASWRTRLMAIAMAAFHRVRSRGRERLALSCGIRGNGWCVTHDLLRRVPYRAFSLTEDIEYGIDLGLADERVHYADEAHVDATMVSGARAAATQRQRWESGRWQLIRSRTLPLLRAAATRRGGRVCLDLAVDLLVLPLTYIATNVVALIGVSALLMLWWPAFIAGLVVGLACALGLTLYVLRGWQLSGVGWRGLIDLARAPFFVVWKLVVMWRTRASTEWVRTEREVS
jgi:1,2-diacylglycerol 3-beta-glucosyltransferase